MSHEKSQTLYNAITDLREDLIEQALPPQKEPQTRDRKVLLLLTACLAMIVMLGAYDTGLFGHRGASQGSGGGQGSGEVYMSYAGPVFPLTAEEGSSLPAVRAIDYDFSDYAPVQETYDTADGPQVYNSWGTDALVTDRYTLTNPEAQDRTVTLLYPFAASLNDPLDHLPVLTVDGQPVRAELHPGPYTGGFTGANGEDTGERLNLAELDSWEKYQALLEAGYQGRAFDPYPVLDRPVKVYRVTDCAAPADFAGDLVSLRLDYHADETPPVLLTYGVNGGSNDERTGVFSRFFSFFPDRGDDPGIWLIALEGDLGDYTINAFPSGSCETPLEGASWRVEESASTLDQVLSQIWLRNQNDFGFSDLGRETVIAGALSDQDLLGLAAELLEDYGILSQDQVERYSFGMLEEIFGETASMGRVFYLRFDVTVPAEGEAQVTASMKKSASMDFVGAGRDRKGYDLVTRLGSSLDFTAQSASVSHTEYVELLDQNFGFDLASGVTEVPLDLDQPHYFLEVVRRGK